MKLKMILLEKTEAAGRDVKCATLEFYPTLGEDPENKAFFLHAPQGYVRLTGVSATVSSQLEVGKSYIFDITPA